MKILSSIIIILLATTSMCNQSERPAIITTLSVENTTFSANNPIEITFAISNNSATDEKICDYHTPFEGIRNNILKVTSEEGKLIDYEGIMAKRRPPTEEDYFVVKSKETKTVQFTVDKEYPMTKAGTYSIQFIGSESINKLPNSNILEIVIK